MLFNRPYLNRMLYRESAPIVDAHDRIVGVVGGKPRGDPTWDASMDKVADDISRARDQMLFREEDMQHRRGDFPAAGMGISFGGGQGVSTAASLTEFSDSFNPFQEPASLRMSMTNLLILSSLFASAGVLRIFGFTNCKPSCSSPHSLSLISNPGLFATFAPQVYAFYQSNMELLLKWNPNLRRDFPSIVFAACTINFGPFTISFPHIDSGNLAFGWCVITALGKFNPDLGGHLILWDLGLVLRLPPGCSVLIPSAILTHSNVPIQQGETRFSIIQYSAGGIFRFISNSYRSDIKFEREATLEEIKERDRSREWRWRAGLEMFGTWSDLQRQIEEAHEHHQRKKPRCS